MKNIFLTFATVVLSFSSFAQNKVDTPHSLAPEVLMSGRGGLPAASGQDAAILAAMNGAIAAALSVSRSEVKRTDLRGSCFYGEPDNRISIAPCNHLEVRLLSEDGKVQATTDTNEKGQFRFYLPAEKKYAVEIQDRKGRTAKSKQNLERGNSVEIFLKP